jgi:EipB-like
MRILSLLRFSSPILVVAVVIGGPWSAAALTPPGEFAAHRAIYELKLAQARGKNGSMAARGRILYDFSGSKCDGYQLEFRLVSEIDNGEGKVRLSDLRSNTWEDGAGKSYRFNSQNYLDQNLADSVDGRAERGADGGITVTLTKPKAKTFDLDAAIVFPTQHIRKIIDAANAGKTILELPVYDGSEGGEKIFNTLTVIGREIAAGERPPTDAASGNPELMAMKRWPVTVSYFDRVGKSGEQVPVYSISFELYENGISRALLLDYNDFAISGELKTLDIKDTKPCS